MLRALTNSASGSSRASIAASAAGWIGSAGCPTTSAGTVISRRSREDGATRPKKMPWTTAATDPGRWSQVSSPMPTQKGTSPRGTGRVTHRSAETLSGRNRAANMSGANAMIPASTALSRTGISSSSPATRSGSRAASSRETLAPNDVPPTTAAGASRWSSSARTWSANAVTEYAVGSSGRSDRPWPSRSRVTTWSPSAASVRASGSCMRRGISCPWSSTTQRSPEPYSVYSSRSLLPPTESSSRKNCPMRSETSMAAA